LELTAREYRKIHRTSQLLASILVNAVYAMKNYPVMILNTFLAPFSLLLVITFISHGTLLNVAIVGSILMTMVSSGIGLQADLSHIKNDFKLQDMIISSETGPMVYLIGMGISEVVYSIPALLVLSVLAVAYIHASPLGWLMIVSAALIILFFSISVGFLLSNVSSDVVQSYAFAALLSTMLSTLAPVYYPISYIPEPYRYAAYLSPTTYVAQIAQTGAGAITVSTPNLVLDLVVVLALSSIAFVIALKRNRWRSV
jgi:ABC-2 type transport system permease protein